MPNSKRYRNGQKGGDEENRTGGAPNESSGYEKLPGNPANVSDENVSTSDNMANPKYSRTNVRKEHRDNDNTRGGR